MSNILVILEGGTLRELPSNQCISKDDKLAIINGYIQIIRFNSNQFGFEEYLGATVEELTWERIK